MSIPRTRIALKDVARLAAVSVNTASKVLNDTRSSTHVSLETRQRITDAAGKLGYEPNSAARSLRRKRSDIITFFVDREIHMVEPFTSALLEGAESACRERKQALLLVSRGTDESEEQIARKLLGGMSDGIIMASWTRPKIIQRIHEAGMPIVLYPFRSDTAIPSVIIDQEQGARQSIGYLAAKGHRQVIYRTADGLGDTRLACFERAADAFGVDLIVIRVQGCNDITEDDRHILARPPDSRPTAIACWNDEYAYEILAYCLDAGLRIPDDVAIIGFDGVHTFPRPRQRLTTVYVPWGDVAHTAISLLVDLRDGLTVPAETCLPVEISVGDTA